MAGLLASRRSASFRRACWTVRRLVLAGWSTGCGVIGAAATFICIACSTGIAGSTGTGVGSMELGFNTSSFEVAVACDDLDRIVLGALDL